MRIHSDRVDRSSCFPTYPLKVEYLCKMTRSNLMASRSETGANIGRRHRAGKLTQTVSFVAVGSDDDDTIQPRTSSRSGGRSGKQVTGRKRAAVDSDQLEELPEERNVHM